MARPLRRDLLAWVSSIPTSFLLLVSLGLPQVRDCHGHVRTAAENGTSPLLVVMALVALAPLAWRSRPLRGVVIVMATTAAALAITSTLLVIPIGIYTIYAKPWRTTEQLVAFSCGCIAVVFVAVFPLVGLFSDWMYGATLTWFSGWLVMAAMFAWASAAQTRASILPAAIVVLRPPRREALSLGQDEPGAPRSDVARVAGRSH